MLPSRRHRGEYPLDHGVLRQLALALTNLGVQEPSYVRRPAASWQPPPASTSSSARAASWLAWMPLPLAPTWPCAAPPRQATLLRRGWRAALGPPCGTRPERASGRRYIARRARASLPMWLL